jgi:molybdate transport system substrate-binding protein
MIKKLSLGLSTAVVMTWSPADAQSRLVVAAAFSFGTAANNIIPAFGNYYITNHNIDYSDMPLIVSGAPNLESSIINGTLYADLFLSSSAEEPEDLARHYPKLVVGEPFVFAIDSLELYSTTVDISDGLPHPLTTNILIPDPTEDNYGAAAAQILASWPWRILASSIPAAYATTPGSLVHTQPSVGQVYRQLLRGRYPYGFVAKSQICQDILGTVTYDAGSYHHEYKPFGRHHYNPELVTLTGIKLAKTRTPDQETELKNFIAFLTGTKDTYGTATNAGTGWIESYCFKLPEHFGGEWADLDDHR